MSTFRTDRISDHLTRYVEMGYWVVPAWGVMTAWPEPGRQACCCPAGLDCSRPGKHPFGDAGKWKGLTRPYTAAELEGFRALHRSQAYQHECNFAIITGRSGLLSLDIDQHPGGADGVASWAELTAQHGELPLTPNDSRRHFLFRCPDGLLLPKTALRIAPGVELFGRSATADHLLYIPPSEHASGESYRWNVAPWEVAPAELPEWLHRHIGELVKKQKASEAASAPRFKNWEEAWQHQGELTDSEKVERATYYIRNWSKESVQGQGGNAPMMSVVHAIKIRYDLSYAEGMPLIQLWNDTKATPSWTQTELDRAWQNATPLAGQTPGYGNVRRTRSETATRRREKTQRRVEELVTKPRHAQATQAPTCGVGSAGACGCSQHTAKLLVHAPTSLPVVTEPQDDLLHDFTPDVLTRLMDAPGDGAELRRVGESAYRQEFQGSRFHCPKCYRLCLDAIDRSHGLIVYRRCEGWACRGCGEFLKWAWSLNFTCRLLACTAAVWRCVVRNDDWETFSRVHLRGVKADYFAFDLDDGTSLVVASRLHRVDDVEGAEQVAPAEAAAELKLLMRRFSGNSKPVTSSRSWKLLRPSPSQETKYEVRGPVDRATSEQEVARCAREDHGAEVEEARVSARQKGWVRRMLKIIFPATTTEDDRREFWEKLTTGTTQHYEEDLTGVPVIPSNSAFGPPLDETGW